MVASGISFLFLPSISTVASKSPSLAKTGNAMPARSAYQLLSGALQLSTPIFEGPPAPCSACAASIVHLWKGIPSYEAFQPEIDLNLDHNTIGTIIFEALED